MTGIRETKKRETRRSILEAAVRLFGERGYEKSSIEQIARAAGVGKGTIYGYFRSKDEIFIAFCEDEIDYAFAQLAEKNNPDAPLQEQLLTLFMSQFRFVTHNREFGRLLCREMVFPQESTMEKSKGLESRYLSAMAEILERAKSRGELRADCDTFITTGHFYSHYLVVLSAWYSRYLNSYEEIETALSQLLQQSLQGLAPQEKRSAG